jgi:hypothetical protein
LSKRRATGKYNRKADITGEAVLDEDKNLKVTGGAAVLYGCGCLAVVLPVCILIGYFFVK